MKTTKKCPKCNTELANDTVEGLCPKCLIEQAMDTKTVVDHKIGAKASTVVISSMPAVDFATITGLFPQLEIIELLGQGGMGVVYKARQPQLDRLVALKILLPEVGKDPQFAERFSREARALAKLNHPNIVAVYDFGQIGGLYYFIMEYVDGTNLRQMERKEKLSSAQALGIIPKICDALQYAHDEGVVHRDIKPENILVDKKGRIKIADFGLAKLVGKKSTDFSITMSNMVMGTPHYMAPEQMEHPTEVDHRADIYSLGVVLYEMLTGELPIGRFALPSQKVHVDVRLDEVVIRTLEKEPERRYQQVSEVKSRVETISGSAVQYAAMPAGAAGLPDDISAIDLARREVRGPATGLIVTAMVNWVSLFMILFFMYFHKDQNINFSFLSLLVGTILTAGSILILIGALKMKRLESYEMARMASILSMVIGPGYLVGLPVGIWALVALSSQTVKAGFVIAVTPKDETPPPTVISKIALWFSILGLVLPVVLGMVVYIFRNSLKVDEAYLIVGCWLLGIVMELVAFGCGIAARRTAAGKAGIIISVISLVLTVMVFLAVFTVRPVPVSGGTSLRETHGPVASFVREVVASTEKAGFRRRSRSYGGQVGPQSLISADGRNHIPELFYQT